MSFSNGFDLGAFYVVSPAASSCLPVHGITIAPAKGTAQGGVIAYASAASIKVKAPSGFASFGASASASAAPPGLRLIAAGAVAVGEIFPVPGNAYCSPVKATLYSAQAIGAGAASVSVRSTTIKLVPAKSERAILDARNRILAVSAIGPAKSPIRVVGGSRTIKVTR